MNEKEVKIFSHEIQMVPISSLKARNINRKLHPVDQINRLAELFKIHGFRNPIIVSNQSKQIVCGTGRYLAAKKAKLKNIPVIFQDYENEEMEYAHHIADNALSLWSNLDFSGINLDLENLGPDFDLDWLGIKDFKLDAFEKKDEKKGKSESFNEKIITCPHCDKSFVMEKKNG